MGRGVAKRLQTITAGGGINERLRNRIFNEIRQEKNNMRRRRRNIFEQKHPNLSQQLILKNITSRAGSNHAQKIN